MPSIGKTISGHNKKILRGAEIAPQRSCTLYDCVVEGQCEEKRLTYQCEVRENLEDQGGTLETHFGLTENSFKDRLTKHRRSFRVQGYHKNTISTHKWNLNRRNVNFELSWRIVAKAKPYSPSSKLCNLCIREIYYIMFPKKMASLNNRSEFFGYCLHKSKYLLKNQ